MAAPPGRNPGCPRAEKVLRHKGFSVFTGCVKPVCVKQVGFTHLFRHFRRLGQERNPYVRDVILQLQPGLILPSGDQIDLRPLDSPGGAAVVMAAAHGGIIRQEEHGQSIHHGVQFNVIVIPILPLRAAVVIDMSEDHHAVGKADRFQISREFLQSRVEEPPEIAAGGLLLPWQQHGHTQAEPPLLRESQLHRHSHPDGGAKVFPCQRMPGVTGKGADTQGNALGKLGCGNRASQLLLCAG